MHCQYGCVSVCGHWSLVCVDISVNTFCILFLLFFCMGSHSAGTFSGPRSLPVKGVLYVHASVPSEL